MKGVTASSLGVLALSLCLAVLPGCDSTAVKAPVITSFTANPTVITAGGSASLTGFFADGTGLVTPGKITIASGTAVSVSPTQTTTYTLTVMGVSGSTAAQSATVTVNATPTAQTITFANPGTQTVGTPLTLSATASSGLTVAFASTTTNICTVNGTTATFIVAGICSITASQTGNSTYAAATPVSQSFTVNGAQFTVGGTVSGLTQSGMLLANGADTLAVAANAASFTMPAPVSSGSSYSVTVQTQPSGQTCSVANGSGTMGSANVTSVAVTCTNSSFTPAWQDLKLGAGGFVTDMLIYPDGTELSRTDTYGFFKWNQSSSMWNQLFTAATIPASDLSPAIGLGGNIGGYGMGACAYPTQSAASLVGTTNILYAVWNATIYKSSNGGVSWVNTGRAVSGADGNDGTQKGNSPYLWCDPASNGQIAYVSTPSGEPLVTTDGGTSWSTVAGIAATASNQGSLIVGDPTSSAINGVTQHIYISSYGTGVYESTDGGTSWKVTSGTPTSHGTMWVDKFGVLWFLNGGGAELYKYSGGVWTAVTDPGSNGGAASLSIDPSSSSESAEHIVLLRPSGQLDVSTNGGQSWSGWDWTTSVSATDIPWLGTADQNGGGALFLDVGKAAFDPLSNLLASGGIGAWIAASPVTTSSNYVSQSAGIEQLVVNRIIVPPGSSPLTAVWDRGIFLQKNPDVYPGSQYSNAVDISAGWDADYASSQPDFLVVVNNSNIGEGDFSGYSSDGGNTWTAFPALPNGAQIGGMIAASSPTNWIDVPGQGQGLYCTTDGGQTWTAVQLPGNPGNDWLNAYYLTRHVLASDRVQGGVFYAYNAGAGLYSSSGGCGGTWTLVHPGYIDANSSNEGYNSSLQAVPGEAGNLFFSNGPVGCGGPAECPDDFYRSTNGGSTWTALPNVHEVIAFGFGAPKPGGSGYPAIYINGWVNHVYGIWQSLDNASTWTQIGTYADNDVDLVTTISGDPNVYGRVYVGFRGSGDAYYDTADACPWVNFSNVNESASLTGTVTLTSEHSGLVPVTDVQYQIDGAMIGSPISGTGPYSYVWNTSNVTAGSHTLTVVATGINCSGLFSIPVKTH
ncbi:MAG: Ig-like domain-containing protein [Terracidiphilus sp.]